MRDGSAHRAALATLALAASALVLGGPASPAGSSSATGSHGHERLIACATLEQRAERGACYEREVAAIGGRGGDDAVIAAFEAGLDESAALASDCHAALHPVGEAAGQRLLDRGEPYPLTTPSSFCHEGYVHGMQIAILESARTGEVLATAGDMCAAPDVSASWSCVHSVGHALRQRAGAGGMPAAARLCDRAERRHRAAGWHLPYGRATFVASCVKGALMEQSLQAPGTRPATACSGVARALATYCDAYLPMVLAMSGRPAAQQWRACDHAAAPAGRAACLQVWARLPLQPGDCRDVPADARRACASQRALRDTYDPSRLAAGAGTHAAGA